MKKGTPGRYILITSVLLYSLATFAFEAGKPLHDGDQTFEEYARELLKDGATMKKLTTLKQTALSLTNKNGMATKQLSKGLQYIDIKFGDSFNQKQMKRFQSILAETGVPTLRPILMAENKVPYWLKDRQPLANFQSTPILPKKADVVIIGAGLTGAAAAYHLSLEVKKRGLKVVVLDALDPANQGSGRNGGNFELYPENFLGDYDGLEKIRYKFLKKTYPDLDEKVLRREAKRQAHVVMNFTSKNRDLFLETVNRERIDAEVMAEGWVRIAQADSEVEGFKEDAELAKCLGREVQIWPPQKILEETNILSQYSGRYTKDGYYHPFKYVTGVLKSAIDKGVALYTRTPVTKIDDIKDDLHLVSTERGDIEAKQVIVATNAHTSELFPELKDIQPWQSQIMETKHVPVQTREETERAAREGKAGTLAAVPEMLVTAKKGDIYAHPMGTYHDHELATATSGLVSQRGSYIQGGGLDTPHGKASEYRRKKSVLKTQLEDRAFLIKGDSNKVPPARVWSGPMAFTPDGLMALGFLRKGIFVASGFNGYGGSFTQAAGKAAALSVLAGKVPSWAPFEVFSPVRFLNEKPLFSVEIQGEAGSWD